MDNGSPYYSHHLRQRLFKQGSGLMETSASILAPEPETASAFNLCPVGFVVYADGSVDASRGCGHRKCYESACETLKRLKESEQCS